MKLLLDTCVWGGTQAALVDAGHDVVWAGEWVADPGDEAILALAHREQRTLVTLDKDFGELAILRAAPHAGIIRIANFAAREQAVACIHALTSHGHELEGGSIVTVEPGRVRVRPPGGG